MPPNPQTKKCARKGCKNDAGKYKTCPSCRAKQREANNRFFGRKHPTDHECETVGCGAIVPPRARFCPSCIKERELAQKREYNRASRAKAKEGSGKVVKASKPRPASPKTVNLAAEEVRLREVRQGLNQELLMLRVMRGAVMPVVGVLQ